MENLIELNKHYKLQLASIVYLGVVAIGSYSRLYGNKPLTPAQQYPLLAILIILYIVLAVYYIKYHKSMSPAIDIVVVICLIVISLPYLIRTTSSDKNQKMNQQQFNNISLSFVLAPTVIAIAIMVIGFVLSKTKKQM